MTMRIAVAISGRGSNLEALARALGPEAPAEIALVLSDKSSASGLDHARVLGIPIEVLANPEDASVWFDRLRRHRIDLLVLAGYLKLVPAPVVGAYQGR